MSFKKIVDTNINEPLTFLEYIENCNNFKHSFKTDSEPPVDDI